MGPSKQNIPLNTLYLADHYKQNFQDDWLLTSDFMLLLNYLIIGTNPCTFIYINGCVFKHIVLTLCILHIYIQIYLLTCIL